MLLISNGSQRWQVGRGASDLDFHVKCYKYLDHSDSELEVISKTV